MRKILILLISTLYLVSCKSSQNIVNKTDTSKVTVESIIEKYNQTDLNFNTIHIKGSTKYKFLNPSLDIRIKNNEIILVSVRVPIAGTVFKALATPNSISYYNKLESEYFEGDYEIISNWLGTEVDFYKLQNMLLGRPMDNLSKESLSLNFIENQFQLSTQSNGLVKNYFIDNTTYNLAKQEFEQKRKNRSATINYLNFKTQNSITLPTIISINSTNKNETNNFRVDYKSLEINTEITFPYEIPEGYEEIEID